jgi:proline dehydrogenase
MAIMRSILLAASQNIWLREHAVHFPFIRRSVSRFMPGETADEALAAAHSLREKDIGTVFTYLGENVTDRDEACKITGHYVEVIRRIQQLNLGCEVSVKLTQLGLDLSVDFCADNLEKIIQSAATDSIVWVDMEASNYVDATLDLYKRALSKHPNVGICLQAYLYRTAQDLANLLQLRPSIRLVKGAYKEPANVALPNKADVDAIYFELAQEMLHAKAAGRCLRAAFGTHDVSMIRQLSEYISEQGQSKSELEVQMLYGIQRAEQERLARDGSRSIVLVAYGNYWYPWFVRRLAERPANLWFILRNIFAA